MKLTNAGVAATVVVGLGLIGGIIGLGFTTEKQQSQINQLENRPATIVVVTATPSATPSASVTPTKGVYKYVPFVTKAVK